MNDGNRKIAILIVLVMGVLLNPTYSFTDDKETGRPELLPNWQSEEKITVLRPAMLPPNVVKAVNPVAMPLNQKIRVTNKNVTRITKQVEALQRVHPVTIVTPPKTVQAATRAVSRAGKR